MEHVLTDCGMTEEAVEEALTAIEAIRGEKANTNTKAPAKVVSRHDQEAVSGYTFSI